MSTCYLVQEPIATGGKRLNTSGLTKYAGELVTLLPAGDQIIADVGAAVEVIDAKLEAFNPDTDFLVATGDPAAIGIACCIAAEKTGYFTLLKWDRQEKKYYPVKIDLRQGSPS